MDSNLQTSSHRKSKSSFPNRNGNSTWAALALIAILLFGVAVFVIISQSDENLAISPSATTHAQKRKAQSRKPAPPSPKVVVELVNSENLILNLTVSLKKLNQSLVEGQLPNEAGRSLFSDSIQVADLNTDDTHLENFDSIATQSFQQEIDPSVQIEHADLNLWQPVLSQLATDSFRQASFKIVRGQFPSTTNNDSQGETDASKLDISRFETLVKFDGLSQLKTGQWLSIHAIQKIHWKNEDTSDSNDWKITHWQQESFETAIRKDLMFQNTFFEAIPKEHQEPLLTSLNDRFVVQSLGDGDVELPFPELRPFLTPDSSMAHPSVSVVDINRDGWDDLYIMTRWRKNRLFVNNQDGTFHEAAEEFGLDWDRTSCAVFVDLDNDGDKDAFLGRCFAESKLLINEDGKFVDQTRNQIGERLPGFITSISVADYDNDGLLDLYLSSHMVLEKLAQDLNTASNFMPSKHAIKLFELYRNMSDADMWLDRPGPPNRLLKNLGNAQFSASEAMPEIWSNTFQATWADYDEDGDVDLYLCNDFAPDFLFRNEGEQGFVDATEEAGGQAMRGYGMGATWGDYDNDGHQDLYVSNMYSKAGKRIISQLPEIDQNYLLSANGNRLFRNQGGGKFDLTSGEGPDDQHVTKAGWSWGGQFCDFDNDGYLDLYVTSGFYTAPKEIACDEDL